MTRLHLPAQPVPHGAAPLKIMCEIWGDMRSCTVEDHVHRVVDELLRRVLHVEHALHAVEVGPYTSRHTHTRWGTTAPGRAARPPPAGPRALVLQQASDPVLDEPKVERHLISPRSRRSDPSASPGGSRRISAHLGASGAFSVMATLLTDVSCSCSPAAEVGRAHPELHRGGARSPRELHLGAASRGCISGLHLGAASRGCISGLHLGAASRRRC